MKILPLSIVVFFLTILANHLPAQGSAHGIKARAPITNFRLPIFDKYNRLSIFIQADKATVINDNRVDISDIRILQYDYKDRHTQTRSTRNTSTLTSPYASFFKQEEEIHGPSNFLFKRYDVEVSGEQWKYFYKEKRITIDKNTHVIFRAPLPKLLN